MVRYCSMNDLNEYQIRILKQAARELLLSQSSDWSFIIRAGTTTELAKERINLHLKRFWILIDAINYDKKLNPTLIKEIEEEDNLFPLISAMDWKKKI